MKFLSVFRKNKKRRVRRPLLLAETTIKEPKYYDCISGRYEKLSEYIPPRKRNVEQSLLNSMAMLDMKIAEAKGV